MSNFADNLNSAIQNSNSLLVAGFDPVLEQLPNWSKKSSSSSCNDEIAAAIKQLADCAIEAVAGQVAAVKPNLAFFEQYGSAGLDAYKWFCAKARESKLLIIADSKRGDIGNTAAAYANAFLNPTSDFVADAVTINPFLGLETLEPYIKLGAEHGKGVFVLVRTSNPGAATLQDARVKSGETISEFLANWVHTNGKALVGNCGLSALGAVVGATAPSEARALRNLMPNNYFLIPGLGAQGGSASDAVAGLTPDGRGGIINVSRGLFANLGEATNSRSATLELIKIRCAEFNQQVNSAKI